jgi:hypothetical protein
MHLIPNDEHDEIVYSNPKEVEMNSIIPELLNTYARVLTFSGWLPPENPQPATAACVKRRCNQSARDYGWTSRFS